MKIKDILSVGWSQKDININGWVRTKRGGKNVSFIALNDGSTINNILTKKKLNCFGNILNRNFSEKSSLDIKEN